MNLGDKPRALYVGPIDARASNGMTQHQHQLLQALSDEFDGRVDVISVWESPKIAQAWINERGIRARVLSGLYASMARWNAILWQALGTALCCKLRLIDYFPFFLTTPLPRQMRNRYARVFSYYGWSVILLKLYREGEKLVVNLGDVMADRHERIGTRQWISFSPRDERFLLTCGISNFAVSQFDAAEFERLYGVRLPVIPSVPAQHAELLALAAEPRPKRIGFFSAWNPANESALRELATPEFLSELRARGIELVVAGSICEKAPHAVMNLLQANGALVLGRVRSLADFYRQVGAMINPVGPSSGLKVKSVETLIAGRSLITTEWGTDGVFDGPFPNQVVLLDWPLRVATFADAASAALADTTGDRSLRSLAYINEAESKLRAFLRVKREQDAIQVVAKSTEKT
jgi:hypothetical protein